MTSKVKVSVRLAAAPLCVSLLAFPLSKSDAKCVSGFAEEQYSTLNGVENGGLALRDAGPDLADAVLVPPTCAIQLVGVVLKVKLQRRDLGSFDVFYSPISKSGQPYDVHIFATVSDSTLTRDFKRVFLQPTNSIVFKANSRYYFGIRKHVGALSTVILGNTVDQSVLKREDVKNGAYSYSHLSQQPNASGVYEMHVILE